MLNEVPLEYFCNVDHEGRRRDFEERPELCTGTVEYIAPAEYMVSGLTVKHDAENGSSTWSWPSNNSCMEML
jgi:hypothetical protein